MWAGSLPHSRSTDALFGAFGAGGRSQAKDQARRASIEFKTVRGLLHSALLIKFQVACRTRAFYTASFYNRRKLVSVNIRPCTQMLHATLRSPLVQKISRWIVAYSHLERSMIQERFNPSYVHTKRSLTKVIEKSRLRPRISSY